MSSSASSSDWEDEHDGVPTTKCSKCHKAADDLKRCAKCKTAHYCNRDCQSAHWKEHKRVCPLLAGTAPKRSDTKPFTAIYNGNFLHDRSETETYQILIDVIRMRQEDVYSFEGDTMVGTIYNQEQSSEPALCKFLRKAKKVPGLLPPWWNDEKAEACVRLGRTDGRFSLECAREKSDIQEEWGDDRMPMKLRMIGERVYGNTPGGTRSDAMLGMMMGTEGLV